MKNLYKYLLAVATVAMAFTSCSKDEISDPSIEVQKVTFTVTSGSDLETPPASRTVFDEETGQMNWSADGEALEVIQILGSEISHATTEAYTIENRVAKFQVSFDALTGSEPYDLTYSAVYPAVNYSDNTKDHTKFRIKLPAEQTPTETGFDPNADLLLAKPETRTAQPAEGEELNFRFKRVAAIAKMTLKGIPAGEKLAKVELTASQPMAGYSRTNLKTGEIYDIGYYKEETMTLTLNDRETTGEDVIWFTSLPCVFGEGDSFTVKAYTDKATYEKTVSFSAPEAFKFVSGGLTRFGITGMTRTENVVDEYVLLTDVADLSVGDQIIITSGTDGAVKALSTEQKSNNRGATDIEIASNTITTIPANAQIITLETGMVANTFAFYVEYTDNEEEQTGYLYAASSTKNQLKTQANIDENASWTIEIAADGVASIQAKDSKNRNLLQYNDSDKNNLLFACYEDTKPQKDVYIFYKAGSPKTALETPTGVEAVAKGNEVLVGWNEVSGAASYTVSFEPATIEPRTIESTGEASYAESFTLDYATEYTVSVVANPADTENYKASAPATATFTTGEDPNQTITPIGKITTEGNYTAEGTVVARGSQAYIIADNTGAMMVYHNGNERAVGEKISISGAVELYSNANGSSKSTPQFTNTATVKVLSTDNVWTYNPTAMDGTAMDALLSGELVCQEVQFEGNLEIRGNYMNVTIPDASTAIGSIKYVETSTVEAYNGKDIIVKGYYVGYSSNQYVNVLPYSVEEANPSTDPAIKADPTSLSFAAAGESKEVTYTAENLGSNQVFAAISGDGAGQFSVGQIEAEFVTVTALENTETTAKTATLTLYIAASEGGEHLDEATVTLTQAGVSGGEAVELTGENMASMSNAGTRYNTEKVYTSLEGYVWTTNGYQTSDITNMIQLRARTHKSGVSWIKLPDFSKDIKKITFTVTSASGDAPGADLCKGTLQFQEDNTKDGTVIASDGDTAGRNELVLDLSSGAYKTGYITCSGNGIRIWHIIVEF